jgi:hypothetical protein
MIVGRSRSHIVGAAPSHHGYGGEYAELMEFTGAAPHWGYTYTDSWGRPMLVGADAPAPPPAPAAPAPLPRGVPVAYVRTQEGPSVIEKHPKEPREFPIGFQTALTTPMPANTTVGIEQKPQVLFRGERLAVPNSIVLNFDVNDIKVGKDSQLARGAFVDRGWADGQGDSVDPTRTPAATYECVSDAGRMSYV